MFKSSTFLYCAQMFNLYVRSNKFFFYFFLFVFIYLRSIKQSPICLCIKKLLFLRCIIVLIVFKNKQKYTDKPIELYYDKNEDILVRFLYNEKREIDRFDEKEFKKASVLLKFSLNNKKKLYIDPIISL